MAFKLSKSDKQTIAGFVSQLQEQRQRLVEAASKYNAVIEDARAFVTGIGSDMQSEYDDKSERWQEGDRASAVQEWIGQLDGIELVEIEIEEEDESVTALEELPEQPEG